MTERNDGFWGAFGGGERTRAIMAGLSVFVLLFVLKSVLVPFLIACILAALTWPWRDLVVKWTRNRPGLSSGLLVLGMVLLVGVPVCLVLFLASVQVRDLMADFSPSQVEGWLRRVQGTAVHLPIFHALGIDGNIVSGKALEMFNDAAGLAANWAFSLGKALLDALVQVGIALMSLFYLYLSGDRMVAMLRNRLPMAPEEVDEVLLAFRRASRAIFKGNFVIGGLQGLATGLLFWGVGLPSPVFFAVLAAFCSLIPAVGTGLVWAPAALFLLLGGEIGRSLVVLGVGAAVISTLDSLLRPVLVGRDAGMHDLMVFLTTIGGLSFFGPVGILFGPLVGAGAMALLRLQEADAKKDRASPGPS